ncbi:MAG: helix-hairpin-helix domain-containing protein [Myxococcales bacterium]|nr:helix-hairpin-helix domain-containing protein [Myxococcales bacterium]
MSRGAPRSARGRGTWIAAAALLAVWAPAMASVLDPPDPSPAVTRCAFAVEVDGFVRCGGPQALAELCGPSAPKAAIRPGDAIDSARACAGAPRGTSAWARMDPESLARLSQPTNLNEASVAELEGLPGVGPKTAAKIVDARPLAEVDDLLDVRGIGPKKLAAVRERVRVRWE